MHTYGYKLPGYFMEYGPIVAESPEKARNVIRTRLGMKRLPPGLKIWDLSERPLAKWRIAS